MSFLLFLDWGIRFEKPYEVPERARRSVAYAGKKELERAIIRRRHFEETAREAPLPDPMDGKPGPNEQYTVRFD